MHNSQATYNSAYRKIVGHQYSDHEIDFARMVHMNPGKYAHVRDGQYNKDAERTFSVVKDFRATLKSLKNPDSVLHWKTSAVRYLLAELKKTKKAHADEQLRLKHEAELDVVRSRESLTAAKYQRDIDRLVRASGQIDYAEAVRMAQEAIDRASQISRANLAVLLLHSEETTETGRQCLHCRTPSPCATRQAIEGVMK